MTKKSCFKQLEEYRAGLVELEVLRAKTRAALSLERYQEARSLAVERQGLARKLAGTRIRDKVTRQVVLSRKAATRDTLPALTEAHDDGITALKGMEREARAKQQAARARSQRLLDALDGLKGELSQLQTEDQINDLSPEEIARQAEEIKARAKKAPVDLDQYVKDVLAKVGK